MDFDSGDALYTISPHLTLESGSPKTQTMEQLLVSIGQSLVDYPEMEVVG